MVVRLSAHEGFAVHPALPICENSAKDGKPLLRKSKQIGIHPNAGSQFCLPHPLLPLRGKWPNREHYAEFFNSSYFFVVS